MQVVVVDKEDAEEREEDEKEPVNSRFLSILAGFILLIGCPNEF